MIAGLTPLEYEAVGTQIRVDTINELSDGSLEVVLQGCLSDATYVRGTLRNQKDIEADEPKQSQRANRAIMTFRVWGTDTNPLTKEKAMSVLRTDPYIEIIQKA